MGELVERKVDFILADPPYYIRYEGIMDQFSHDLFTQEYMADLVRLGIRVLAPGGHGHLFCS